MEIIPGTICSLFFFLHSLILLHFNTSVQKRKNVPSLFTDCVLTETGGPGLCFSHGRCLYTWSNDSNRGMAGRLKLVEYTSCCTSH